MMRDASRSRLVLGVLLVVCLVLLVLDSRTGDDPVTSAARRAGAAVFGPVSAGVTFAVGPVSDAYRTVAAAPGARAEIEELRARNSELRGELRSRDRDTERSAELDRLLGLAGLGGYRIVAAHAVTRLTPQGYADTVTLDAGERDGVHTDMTVVCADGLVGRVVRAGARSATVQLLTDGASTVGARLEGSSEIGTISGTSRSIADSEPLRFELLDASAEVAKGERIVTLGSHGGSPFVPGVPIGRVTKVEDTPGALSRTAEVAPSVDLGSLDIVGVVVGGPKKDPRDSVLPPKPGKGKDGKPADKAKDEDKAKEEIAADDGESSREVAPVDDTAGSAAESAAGPPPAARNEDDEENR